MALKNTKLTKTINTLTIPTDKGSDFITKQTDAWVDGADDPARREKYVKWGKKGIRWLGRAAAAKLVWDTTRDLGEAVSQFSPSELTPGVSDVSLALGWVAASMVSTERGNKMTRVEYERPEYADPNDVGGLYWDSATGKVRDAISNTELPENYAPTSSVVIFDKASMTSTDMFVGRSGGHPEDIDGVIDRLYVFDGKVVKLATATNSTEINYDPATNTFSDAEGNSLNYAPDLIFDGRLINIDSGQSVKNVYFNAVDSAVLDLNSAEVAKEYYFNPNITIMKETTSGDLVEDLALDERSGVVFDPTTGMLDQSVNSKFDVDRGLIIQANGELVDPRNGTLYNPDGSRKTYSLELSPDQPAPADALSSVRSTQRIIKNKWSNRTNAGSARSDGFVKSIAKGKSDIAPELINGATKIKSAFKNRRNKRRVRGVKEAQKKAAAIERDSDLFLTGLANIGGNENIRFKDLSKLGRRITRKSRRL